MKPPFFAAVAALATTVPLARPARATGVCEDTGVTYDAPELFDPTTRSFAIPAADHWCEEQVDGGSVGEGRGSVSFVELRDVTGQVLGWISTATGADAARLQTDVGKVEAVAYGKLHATLVQRGYAPLAAPKACRLATAWTDLGPGGGWQTGVLQLDVERQRKRIERVPLGTGSVARRGDQIVRAHAMPKRSAIAVFALVPVCSGPPPGYFSPGDPGTCYVRDKPVVVELDTRATPALAACF